MSQGANSPKQGANQPGANKPEGNEPRGEQARRWKTQEANNPGGETAKKPETDFDIKQIGISVHVVESIRVNLLQLTEYIHSLVNVCKGTAIHMCSNKNTCPALKKRYKMF